MSGIVDLIVDVIIFVLPIPMVLKLQVSRAHRIALISIFGAGVLYVIIPWSRTSIYRPLSQIKGSKESQGEVARRGCKEN